MKTKSNPTTPNHNETRKLFESTVERLKREIALMESLENLSGWVSVISVKFGEEDECDYFLESDGGCGISPSCSLNAFRSHGIYFAHLYAVRMLGRLEKINSNISKISEIKPSAVPFKVWNFRMIKRLSEILDVTKRSLSTLKN